MEKVKLEDVRVAKVDYKQWSPELQAEYDARVRAVEKISDALQQFIKVLVDELWTVLEPLMEAMIDVHKGDGDGD